MIISKRYPNIPDRSKWRKFTLFSRSKITFKNISICIRVKYINLNGYRFIKSCNKYIVQKNMDLFEFELYLKSKTLKSNDKASIEREKFDDWLLSKGLKRKMSNIKGEETRKKNRGGFSIRWKNEWWNEVRLFTGSETGVHKTLLKSVAPIFQKGEKRSGVGSADKLIEDKGGCTGLVAVHACVPSS